MDMRTLLMMLALLGLGACAERPDIVQQSFNPGPAPLVGNTAAAAVPGPPGDLPTGAAHKVCVTAVNLC
jgi:hypothetical protein